MATPAAKSQPLRVELPKPKDDRALTGLVGVVAAVSFVVGLAWPRLLDVKVGPDVPGGGSKAATPSASSAPKVIAPAESAAPVETAPSGAPEEEAATNKQLVTVSDGVVVSCRTKKNDKPEDCGKLGLDKLVKGRFGDLARCPSALGLEGELTLHVGVNFDKSEVVIDNAKKKSEVPVSTLKGVAGCAAEALKDLELEKLTHTFERYTVAYDLSFYPPGKAPAAPGAEGTEDDAAADTGLGRATVSWEKALLRENPKEGKVVARVPQGTRVKLLEKKDDWFLVESSKGKGWVYRQAIGK